MPTKAYQTTLEYGDQSTYSGSSSWTAVTTIEAIEPPTPEADDIDVTHLSSADEFREFLAGWADGGEMTMTVQWDETQSVALYALFRTQRGYRVNFPSSSGR